MPRKHVQPEELTALITDVFGGDRRLAGLRRLDVATKKGVYRLTLDDATEAMLYVWHPDENYWPGGDAGPDRDAGGGQFGDPYGLDAYLACKEAYDRAGVRTARTIAVDRSLTRYPAELAIVEYLPGGTLEALLGGDPAAARPVLAELAGFLSAMREERSAQHGRIAHLTAGATPADAPPHQIVFEQALANLDEAAGWVPDIAAARGRIVDRLHDRVANIEGRTSYSLVHGELGPDHVMLDDAGRPAIVDLEGTSFTDVESEHVFTRLRFGRHYEWLRVSGLDPARLSLYQLAMHLSLVAGPMRMISGDHPERDVMREIAEANAARVLSAI